MYTRYLLKYFGIFTVFIDCAMIGFQKHRLINHGNTIFRFRQPSLNSAKPPRPALCGFALSPELSNSLRFGPNNTMSRVGTESLLLFIFRESGKYAINEYPAGI